MSKIKKFTLPEKEFEKEPWKLSKNVDSIDPIPRRKSYISEVLNNQSDYDFSLNDEDYNYMYGSHDTELSKKTSLKGGKSSKQISRKRISHKKSSKRISRKRKSSKRISRKRISRKRKSSKRISRKRISRKRISRKRISRKRINCKRISRKN